MMHSKPKNRAALFLLVAVASLHPFTGIVTHVTPDKMDMNVNGEIMQFTRKKGLLFEPKVGDLVTVWSDLTAEKMKKRGAPGTKGSQTPPDDRAFDFARDDSGNKLPGT